MSHCKAPLEHVVKIKGLPFRASALDVRRFFDDAGGLGSAIKQDGISARQETHVLLPRKTKGTDLSDLCVRLLLALAVAALCSTRMAGPQAWCVCCVWGGRATCGGLDKSWGLEFGSTRLPNGAGRIRP
eukprot:1149062-Pelagomonas_calceolata.AAC.9